MAQLPPELILMLLEYVPVTELVEKMRVDTLWRELAQSDDIWDSLLTAKQLRDLMYLNWDTSVALGIYDFPATDVHQAPLVKYIWYELLAKRRRPLLLRQTRPNRSSFVMFMFIWNALPHLYVDSEGFITGITPTSSMTNEGLIEASRRVDPQGLDEDYRQYEMDLRPQYQRYLASLTPSDFFTRTQSLVPTLWIDITPNPNNVRQVNFVVRRTYGRTSAITLRIVDDNTGITYDLRNNAIAETNMRSYQEGITQLQVDYSVDAEGNVSRAMSVSNSIFKDAQQQYYVHDRPQDVPKFTFIFVSVNGKGEYAACAMLLNEPNEDNPVRYLMVPEGEYFYNHDVIRGREDRIRSCIGCHVQVESMCSDCSHAFCQECFSDTTVHKC